jgi:metallo-beta-lactamase family protein
MTEGAETTKLHGRYIPVRAQVENLHMLSAHADADEILAWLRHFRSPQDDLYYAWRTCRADALRHRISEELGWACTVPDYRDQSNSDE